MEIVAKVRLIVGDDEEVSVENIAHLLSNSDWDELQVMSILTINGIRKDVREYHLQQKEETE